MEVSVKALEAGVDIRRHRNQKQLDVDLFEAKAATEAAQPQIGAFPLGRVGCRLDVVALPLGLRVRRRGKRLAGEQAVDMRLRDVEAAEAIVRFWI